MPTPENNDYVSMDARLSAVHQQFITQRMNELSKLLVQHDQEIMILGLTILALSFLVGYNDMKLRRFINGHYKSSSPKLHSVRMDSTKD